MLDWKRLAIQFSVGHEYDVQYVRRVELNCRMLDEALDGLARLGHVYHIEPGVGKPLPDFPKMKYHVDAAPNGRLVKNEWEEKELGDDWYDSVEESQHQYGREQQYRGRGGVTVKGLPAVQIDMGPTVDEVLSKTQKIERARLDLQSAIEMFKLGRSQ